MIFFYCCYDRWLLKFRATFLSDQQFFKKVTSGISIIRSSLVMCVTQVPTLPWIVTTKHALVDTKKITSIFWLPFVRLQKKWKKYSTLKYKTVSSNLVGKYVTLWKLSYKINKMKIAKEFCILVCRDYLENGTIEFSKNLQERRYYQNCQLKTGKKRYVFKLWAI